MSKGKPAGPDTEQALLTLDQLSQTIEVMSAVVDRLKRHLSRQLRRYEQQCEDDAQEQQSAVERKSRLVTPDTAQDQGRNNVELEISSNRRGTSRRFGRVIH